MPSDDIALVSMPWAPAQCPSIQLGILESVLVRAGIRARSHSLYLRFAETVAKAMPDGKYTAARYHALSRECHSGIGEWIFSVPPLVTVEAFHTRDAAFLEHLAQTGHSDAMIACYRDLRGLATAFLEQCVEDVLATSPRIVGFTSTFSQNTASLALATMLVRACPELMVVFGGANCEAPMGDVLFETFDCIDVVVRGEAETVVVPLVRALLEGRPVPRYTNVLARDADSPPDVEPPSVVMDDVPAPIYDEYFATLRASRLVELDGLDLHLPVESARGCWWGEKHHCIFCGLNGSTMKFRSKSAERFLDEIRDLVERHAVTGVAVVDNILDHAYLKTLLPMLAQEQLDIDLAYEVKANLRYDQIRMLKAAGVSTIQPGIESLSTPILREMDKGTTALQNIRLLKWCAEVGIHVAWNILTGFPHEAPSEYAAMAELCPSLFHFAPPNVCRLGLNRNSPLFDRATEHGIRIGTPLPFYRHVYPAMSTDELARVAYFFTYGYTDGKTHGEVSAYVAPLAAVVEDWARRVDANRNALTYRALAGTIRIDDRRDFDGTPRRRRHTLRGVEAAIYRACEGGTTPHRLLGALELAYPGQCSLGDVREFCDELVEHRLMCFVDGSYLSLAIRHPEAVARRIGTPADVEPAPLRMALPVIG